MVGKDESVLKLPYLQNDKQQDGRSTKVCLCFFVLIIINVWIGQVKFGTEQIVTFLRTIRKIFLLLNYLNMR